MGEAAVRGVYASARRSLDQALDDPSWNALPQGEFAAGFEVKPAAIIVDADETFIDNSGAEQPVTRKSIVTALQQQSAFDGYAIAAQ